jgi:uncharacterized membrane protein YbaN (DUF454 family)
VVFLAAGSLSLAVGLVGIVVPLLPTTPLLLLAAACYARSSERCYRWLTTNRMFGRQLDDYLHGRGMSWKVQAGILAFLWTAITLTAVLAVHALWLRVLLFLIATGVSVHVLTMRRTRSGRTGRR